MTPDRREIKKIAELAKLNISHDQAIILQEQLGSIFKFISEINHAETNEIKALAHSQDLTQSRRKDEVTETNQRETFQKIAPKIETGLYIVPEAIDTKDN